MILSLLVAAMLQLMPNPTPAPPMPPPPRRRIVPLGVGEWECSTLLNRTSIADARSVEDWLGGYLSGWREYRDARLQDKDLPMGAAVDLLRRHCAKSPNRTVSWAAGQLQEDLTLHSPQ